MGNMYASMRAAAKAAANAWRGSLFRWLVHVFHHRAPVRWPRLRWPRVCQWRVRWPRVRLRAPIAGPWPAVRHLNTCLGRIILPDQVLARRLQELREFRQGPVA